MNMHAPDSKICLDIPITDVKVNGRYRKDLGDVKSLAESIATVGLMHPIVVNLNKDLIAGHRRLEACKLLGWKEVPVTILNLDQIVLGEFHENSCRKEFTMSERVAILEAIKEQRIGHRTTKERVADLPPFQLDHKATKSRKIASKLFGLSERELSKEAFIVNSGNNNVTRFGSLIAKVDSGRMSVDSAYGKIKDSLWLDKQLADNGQLMDNYNKATAEDKLRLLEGDFRDIASHEIKGNSVDLIFTDPPYNKVSLATYKDLARMADRVLREGGSLITYIGQYAMPTIFRYIMENSIDLNYWWQFCVLHQGPFARYMDRQFVVKWKPLLWFVKGSRPLNPSFPRSATEGKRNFLSDVIISKKPDKRFHNWSQSNVEAEYCIKFLTAQNDLVLDPFMGAGTTAIACENLSRRFVGIDIDTKAIELTKANLRLNA